MRELHIQQVLAAQQIQLLQTDCKQICEPFDSQRAACARVTERGWKECPFNHRISKSSNKLKKGEGAHAHTSRSRGGRDPPGRHPPFNANAHHVNGLKSCRDFKSPPKRAAESQCEPKVLLDKRSAPRVRSGKTQKCANARNNARCRWDRKRTFMR